MSCIIAIDYIQGETRLGVLNDDQLIDFAIFRETQSSQSLPQKDQIYSARVKSIAPHLNAAFVELKKGHDGFLPLSPNNILKEGHFVLVQIKKEGREEKLPYLSQTIEIQTPEYVITPQKPGINFSKKIHDVAFEERLKTLLSAFVPNDIGVVIRTDALKKTDDWLSTSIQQTLLQLQDTLDAFSHKTGLIFDPTPLAARIEHFLDRFETPEIHIEGIELFNQLKTKYPDARFYSDSQTSLFDQLSITEEIEQKILNTIFVLENGASLHIEETAAFVSIDINTAQNTSAQTAEEGYFQTNLNVLKTLKKLIVLRKLSGQILVDFIHLKNPALRNKLKESCKKLTKDTDLVFHGFTNLGLGEFSRPYQDKTLKNMMRSPEGQFFEMIRYLKYQRVFQDVILSSPLYSLWQQDKMQPTIKWLESRLGFKINARIHTFDQNRPFQITRSGENDKIS